MKWSAFGKVLVSETGDVIINDTYDALTIMHGVTGFGSGRKIVTTGGTQVALAATTAALYVKITAETDNTDIIAVGGSDVVEADGTRTGMPLYAGESTPWIPCDDLADIWIDSAQDGEGVTFIYLT